MKIKPKTELRVLAAMLLTVAAILAVGTVAITPSVLTILRTPWQKMFTTQFYHYHMTAIIRQTVFIISPCIVVINTLVAWWVFRCAKRTPDPS
jgi:hypothetical protein